jgi:Flp pilus assembly protein TadD
LGPDDAEAHNNLGVLLNNMGRKEAAKREYREAIRIKPDDAEAHANLGILLSKTGKREEAKDELEIAKRLFEAEGREEDVKPVPEDENIRALEYDLIGKPIKLKHIQQ